MRVEVVVTFGGETFYVPQCSAPVAKRSLMQLLNSSGAMPYWLLARSMDVIDRGVRRRESGVVDYHKINGGSVMVSFVNQSEAIASILKARAGIAA